MTQAFPFRPSPSSVFQFSPTLDGQVYSASVPWLLFGARYYLNLQTLAGDQVWYGAVVGSPTAITIQALSWANGRATATLAAPHGYRVASTVSLTVAGCTPDDYDGTVQALVTGPLTVAWPIAADPGPASVLGAVSRDINLISGVPNAQGGYFASTLVFRTASQAFEASP